jgi:hypothetical protein
MSMIRVVLGILAGLAMALSGVAHSVLGWRALQQTLATTDIPADVRAGLAVPWHFAGMAMVLSGVLAIATVLRMRGGAMIAWPAVVVGAAWILFGLWGLVAVKRDPTFLMFILPGALLLLAVIRR